jgi:hypothetical protein
MAPRRQKTITLTLEGERAKNGIELNSLERFIDAFRDALRDFERSETAREYQIGRGGHPDARSLAATSFRLVGYKRGSAILDLEEAAPRDDDKALPFPTEGIATQNLTNLLDSIDSARPLDPAVIDDLDEAVRALGEDGSFRVKLPARKKKGRVDTRTIAKLRKATRAQPVSSHRTVYGRLHLIEVEGSSPRIEIRATDGYNWSGSYPRELEPMVVRLVGKQVRASGYGTKERANRGSLELEAIEPLPQYEQTPLFTFGQVPASKLEQEQGITGPQGLAAVAIAGLPDDQELDRYLELTLEG